MITCLLVHALKQKCCNVRPAVLFLRGSSLHSSDTFGADNAHESRPPAANQDSLRGKILQLKFPNYSANAVLQHWVAQGNKAKHSELRRVAQELKRLRRYKHALEVMTWMENRDKFQMLAVDHAFKLEMILRVHGSAEAEDYFDNIHGHLSQKTACLPLLHSFVKDRATEKAEAFMLKMQNLGLIVNSCPFNEMMKLYMATQQFQKVSLVIEQMKHNNIPLNVLSYNLWMGACDATSGVVSAEKVYREMLNDRNVEVGWSTLSTLANIYIRSDLHKNAITALKAAEKKLSTKNRLGYFFLMTLHASLNNRDGVLRLWQASKQVSGRISCANYMCLMSCLVKLEDIRGAEIFFRTWESQCLNYDIRVSNILLGAYVRRNWMDKAEFLHHHTLERGGRPNYKTWEILMEGWTRNKQMDKAVEAMKKGFPLLKECDWRPPSSVVMAIAEFFEEQGSVEIARKYVKVLRRLNLMSLPVYKSLLRIHIQAHRPAPDVLHFIESDNVQLDEEVSSLIQRISKMTEH